jgi:hypothetical protein
MSDFTTATAGNTNSSSPIDGDDDYFSFKYTESVGVTARYLMILFDSITNTLTSSTDISGSNNLSHKPVSDSEKQELKDEITKNNFFNSKPDYPPEKEDDPSLIAYSLTVTIGGDKTHTITWTKDSKEIPDGIVKIVDAIRRITAKEKIV